MIKSNQSNNALDKIEEGLEVIVDIFKIRQPDLNKDEFLSEIDTDIYTAIVNNIFADMTLEETMEKLKEAKESIKDGKKKPPQAES